MGYWPQHPPPRPELFSPMQPKPQPYFHRRHRIPPSKVAIHGRFLLLLPLLEVTFKGKRLGSPGYHQRAPRRVSRAWEAPVQQGSPQQRQAVLARRVFASDLDEDAQLFFAFCQRSLLRSAKFARPVRPFRLGSQARLMQNLPGNKESLQDLHGTPLCPKENSQPAMVKTPPPRSRRTRSLPFRPSPGPGRPKLCWAWVAIPPMFRTLQENGLVLQGPFQNPGLNSDW